MVTGRDVIRRALMLMGYVNSYGEVDEQNDAELFKRGQNAVQQVFDDLRRIEYGSARMPFRALDMSEPIPLSDASVQDVMPYGVAMFLAGSEGNGDSQAMFAQLYNRKRSSAPRPADRRRNVLPGGGY